MRRFKYGYNGQWQNMSRIGLLTPIGYMETVPGETWSGKTTINFWSDTTNQPWTNRMFADVFAFYVPYRLLWNNFPDMIRGDVTQDAQNLTVPVATDDFLFNYQNTGGPSAPNVFFTRAYNLIHQKYFSQDNPEDTNPAVAMGNSLSTYDDTTVKGTLYRPSTFHETVRDTDNTHASEEINAPVTGTTTQTATFNMDEIRAALSRDNFQKLRDYYGSRYVDYLAAIGVKGEFAMLDEPELIGKVHHTLPLEVTQATNDLTTETQFIGTPGAQWKGSTALVLKKSFVPEHGLICFYSVNRLDCPHNQSECPAAYMFDKDDFWSPELQVGKVKNYDPGIFGAVGGNEWFAPDFEHLRKGVNMTSNATAGPVQEGTYFFDRGTNQSDANTYVNANSNSWNNVDNIFDNTFGVIPGTTSTAHFTITADHRLSKNSPVKPNNFREPLR